MNKYQVNEGKSRISNGHLFLHSISWCLKKEITHFTLTYELPVVMKYRIEIEMNIIFVHNLITVLAAFFLLIDLLILFSSFSKFCFFFHTEFGQLEMRPSKTCWAHYRSCCRSEKTGNGRNWSKSQKVENIFRNDGREVSDTRNLKTKDTTVATKINHLRLSNQLSFCVQLKVKIPG